MTRMRCCCARGDAAGGPAELLDVRLRVVFLELHHHLGVKLDGPLSFELTWLSYDFG